MGNRSTKPFDLLNNEQLKNQTEQPTNDKEKEEKEIKAKKKYYGKIFVIFIFFVILFQYYNYVYIVMLNKLKGKIVLLDILINNIII